MKFDKKYLLAVVGIVALYAIFLIISDLQVVSDKIQNFNTDYLPIILSIVFLSWIILFLRSIAFIIALLSKKVTKSAL